MKKYLLFVMMMVLAGWATGTTIPDPAADIPLAKQRGRETVVFAGGCFWGVQAVFEQVKGVKSATAGFAGGASKTARYERVSDGNTGHAESVQVTYDPSQITFGQLLKIFFSVVHDPTELNRQGPDTGTQYRSAIFYHNDEQKRIAATYIEQLNAAKVFRDKIVTELSANDKFYPADEHHQHYLVKHPDDPYIINNDIPKVRALHQEFPQLFVGTVI
ncbi:MAG: peptide methionine sulfoxide reductase [Acidobacteriales bacterium]|nr:peptide methionine sulfoxide reductase [Terriglobales bacterium]